MRNYLILFPIFLFALLQGAFLPLNLVLLVVIFFAVFRPGKESFLVAFFSGLFLDLAKGITLGVSSLILLFICYLLRVYSRHFNSRQPIFLAIFSSLAAILWSRVFQGFFDWRGGIILFVLALFLAVTLRSFWFPDEGKIKI